MSLCDILSRLDEHSETDEGESQYDLLFEHVGVEDRTDWRAVALTLAARHVPELLIDGRIHARAPAGRPTEWNPWRLTMLVAFVEIVKRASRDGDIRSDLTKDRHACQFIAGRYEESQWIRDALRLKPGVSYRTLEEQLRRAKKLMSPKNYKNP